MVNRNAVRHLALVVSVLLCFFVYMGYRFRGGSREPAIQPTGQSRMELAGLTIDDSPPGQGKASLMTMRDSPSASPQPIRPPINTPTGPSSVRAAMEMSPDIVALHQSERDTSSMAPPSLPVNRQAMPSGSLEESAFITGLMPAPPADRQQTLAPPAEFLPMPVTTFRDSPPQAGQASGGLKPPGTMPEMPGLPLPPTFASQGAGDKSASTRRAVVAPPPPPVPTSSGRAAETRTTQAASLTERRTVASAPNASEALRIYVIRPGDTLTRIAARELGSIGLADNIFLLNRDVIADQDHLQVGTRIRLPVKQSLNQAGGSAGNGNGGGAAARREPQAQRLHRVGPGETLSSISLRYYGSSSGWRFLYQANNRVISNPNQVPVGTELVIPPYQNK